ncbi:hypothetical protein QX233_12960 [Chryseobacterium gambrini]|uniref:Uncharacterized protein n=1 Tax=Chryseobacterium gambrini TaxID=373672 RepID=A0AAJ1R4E1_9FLAO|nr:MULTISPECIES: hypothetical protein [Chryseobacterium]MDN4013379.1 hypothetical protein [Chryseobacterium gambrini]MDN4031330.1 hypothetical protein [Chryseobacterium gambrini]QWA39487.1 hypothetical protein KKI44_04560 [Chryseobacterium sp. ZHDP1]
MKEIIDKNLHLIVISALVILVGYWYLSSLNGLKNISKRKKYTLAVATSDWHHKNNNGIGVDYEYFIDSRKYYNTINLDLKKGQKYLLVFDSLHHENNVLLDIYPMDDFLSPPTNGWNIKELPIYVDTVKINNSILETN